MNKQIKSFFQVLSSNIFVSFSGIFTGVLIPILLTETEYGYWQYYLTYASYAALLLFGFCDGIYIKYGGEKYETIDKQRLNYMYYFMIAMLTLITSVLFLLVIGFGIKDSTKKITLFAVLGSVFLQCVISFFTLLNQATGRFKIYSVGNTIERSVLLITALFCIWRNSLSILPLLIISIISKMLVVFYYAIHSKDVILIIPHKYNGWREDIRENFVIGLPITVCGIISLVMGGFGKMFIEWTSGMVNLAYYSFACSSISIISQVIVAASLVVFPSLKNANEYKIDEFIHFGENIINATMPILMLSYYPILIAVSVIINKYLMSMKFVPVILPMILFQSKINILYANTYKVRRKERELMKRGGIGLGANILLVSFFYLSTKSLMMVALASTLSYLIWYYSLRKGMGEKFSVRDVIMTLFIVVIAVAEIYCSVGVGLLISIIASVIYIALNKKVYLNTIKLARRIKK